MKSLEAHFSEALGSLAVQVVVLTARLEQAQEEIETLRQLQNIVVKEEPSGAVS